jgi:serine protease Do
MSMLRGPHFIGLRRAAGLLAGVLTLQVAVPMARGQQDDGEPQKARITRAGLYASIARDVEELEKHSTLLKKVVKVVQPTVVHIEAEKVEKSTSLTYGKKGQIEEAGSGFVVEIGKQFYVLTNRHVIKSARLSDIKIKQADGRMITPLKAWLDAETDVGVLAVPAARMVGAKLGNSDLVEIGDFVLAAGSPFGLSHSVTFGIVSAKGRRDLQLGDESVTFQDFLQTDAAINPGNSGGPLINLRGEVIGMNTAIASQSGGSEGIGFAIPINMAMAVARQFAERGTLVRAQLGVHLDSSFTAAVAEDLGLGLGFGSRVREVTQGSAAELARLRPGDVILEYNGVKVEGDSHLISLVSMSEVGKDVPIVIYRDRKTFTVTAKPNVKRPATPAPRE